MNLSFEYNEYIIGYVVTDEDTGRSCNFQFDHNRLCNYSPVGQKHFLTSGCEGDDTDESFSEEELDEMKAWLRSYEKVKHAESLVTEAHSNFESHEKYCELCAESDIGVFICDIEAINSQA